MKILLENLKSRKSVNLVSGICVFISLLILSLLGSQIFNVNTDYSFEDFFPKEHSLLLESQEIRKTFLLEESPTFLALVTLPPDGAHWLSEAQMKKLEKASLSIQFMDRVLSVDSLATLEGAYDDGDAIIVGPIFKELSVSNWPEYVAGNRLIESQMISSDWRSTLILIEPNTGQPDELMTLYGSIENTLQEAFPAGTLSIGGAPAIQGQFTHKLFNELFRYLAVSLILFSLVFFFFLPSLSSLALTLFCLATVNLSAMGMLAHLDIPFSVLLSTLPVILSIAVVSIMIHTMHRFAAVIENSHKNKTNSEMLVTRFHLSLKTLSEMFTPNFLGALTTGIGFLALTFSPIPLIREYGLSIAGTLALAFILTQLLLLGLMPYTRPKVNSLMHRKSTWSLGVIRKSPALLAALTVVLLLIALTVKPLSFSGRLFDDLPAHDPIRIATESIDKKMGGSVPLEITLSADDYEFWTDPAHIHQLNKTSTKLSALPGVGSLISVADFIPKESLKSSATVSEYLFLSSLSDNNPLKHFITPTHEVVRLSFRLFDHPSSEVKETRQLIMGTLKNEFKSTPLEGLKVNEAGLAVTSHTINSQVSKKLIFNFWHSLAFIGLILALIFRSLRWGLVAAIPNLLPPTILFYLLSSYETPIKPGVALIFCIALGLAFNNTVYLLCRLKKILSQKNIKNYLPIKKALYQEGNPCLFEVAIMICGFLIFLTSDFATNQIFGVYMISAILAGAAGDLLLLPSLLKKFPGLLMKPTSSSSTSLADKNASETHIEEPRPRAIQKAAGIALILLASMFYSEKSFSSPQVDPEAERILRAAQKNLEAKDDEANVKMTIIEPNGSKSTREMSIKTMRQDKFYALVKLTAPANLRGTGFLAHVDEKEESQWVYMPSSGQVRRLVGAQRNSGILGSELTIEDLNSQAIKHSSVKLLRRTPQMIVLEVVPESDSSIYNRVVIGLHPQNLVPLRTEYFKDSKAIKRVTFENYRRASGNIWRAHKISVRNLQNRRGTDLELSGYKINQGFSTRDFSTNVLSD